jgi:hypothetical protein
MLSFNDEFTDSKLQIEAYLDFIENIEIKGLTQLTSISSVDIYTLDDSLAKILKANAFLMLYNLIEATVKNCLWEVFSSIKLDNTPYDQLCTEIQNILLLSKIKLEFKTREESVATQVQTIIETVMMDLQAIFPKHKKGIMFPAGSLNVEKIQDTFKKHGLNKVNQIHDSQEDAFRVVVFNRNNLAHGDSTFKECGRQYSLLQLVEYKKHVFEYLDRSISEAEVYIESKKYVKNLVA